LSGLSGNGLGGRVHGAGGIGGMLACVQTRGTADAADDKTYWYFRDANGNVGQAIDATDSKRPRSVRPLPLRSLRRRTPVISDVDGSGFAGRHPFRFSTTSGWTATWPTARAKVPLVNSARRLDRPVLFRLPLPLPTSRPLA